MRSREARQELLAPKNLNRVRKLIKDSFGDALNVQQTNDEFHACRETILTLLDAFEALPPAKTFTAWAFTRRATDTPAGDFIADWLRDLADFEPSTEEEMLGHIALRGAGHEAQEAAVDAWKQYVAWMKDR